MLRLIENLPGWRLRHPWLTDALLIALVVGPPVIRAQPGWRPVWVQLVVYAGFVVPLFWRRTRPVLAASVVTAAFWAQYLGDVWGREPGRGVLALSAVLYTLVVRGLRRTATVVALCAASCVLLWVPDWLSDSATAGPDTWFTPALVVLWLAGSWTLGAYVRARRAYLAEFARRAELTESRRAALARAAAAEERARIAREIHDVLAHGVSVMVLNAEGARLARATDPTAADRALAVIGTTGREALGELRRLLDVLGPDGEQEQVRAPDLTDLRTLADRCGARLDVCGDPAGVSADAVEQTYRIVQEALTNVTKHASPGARTRVRIDLGSPGPGRRVRVRVDNSAGTGTAPVALPVSAGRGLAGMRERAARYGGTVAAGQRPGGGYRVDAVLRPEAVTA
ncbi:histidine kinase [Streptomyces sp. NPDC091215]|uniref:sensor histidine kinase n=1 Tax=Streptomyces sp. NPDC091215 TaxID=3155192 RepID=UPI0034477EF1